MALAGPAAAPAATIIGSTGTPDELAYPNSDNRVWVQDVQAGEGGPDYTAPVAGVITSWSSMANAVANRTQKLLITRNADADTTWDVVGRDVLRTLVTPSALNVFTGVRVPVAAGDQIALYTPDGQPGGNSSAMYISNPSTNVARSFTGAEPGTSFTASSPDPNTRLNVVAAIEPDKDCDGFGDETQDPAIKGGCLPRCKKGFRLKKIKTKSGKKKKKCVRKKKRKK